MFTPNQVQNVFGQKRLIQNRKTAILAYCQLRLLLRQFLSCPFPSGPAAKRRQPDVPRAPIPTGTCRRKAQSPSSRLTGQRPGAKGAKRGRMTARSELLAKQKQKRHS